MPLQDDGHPPPTPLAEKGTTPARRHRDSTLYRIRLKGQLHSRWSTWFDHLTVTLDENGDTVLTGPIVDQAALQGILTRVRDLGLPLISVQEGVPEQASEQGNAATADDFHLHKETNA